MKTYGLSRADLCHFAKAKLTPEILYAERNKIGGRLPDPAVEAGYETEQGRKRFVDNAFSRPMSAEKSRLLVEMLMHCKARNRWKGQNFQAYDPWQSRYWELRAKGVPFITPIEQRARVVRCSIVPDDIEFHASELANAIKSKIALLSGHEKEIANVIAEHLRSRELEMTESYAHWVERGETMLYVRARKTEEIAQPERVKVRRNAVVVLSEKGLQGHNQFHLTQTEMRNLGLSDQDGAVPTPSQFLRGLIHHFRLPPEQRVPKRVTKALEGLKQGLAEKSSA